jgi:hypothetical protein
MYKTSLVTEFALDAWEFAAERGSSLFNAARVLDTQRRIDAVFATSVWKASHA